MSSPQGPARSAFLLGSVLGLTAVILGAMGAHLLKSRLNPEQLVSFETAVRFQMYHAFFLLLMGLLYLRSQHRLLRAAIWLALAGVVMFSGSIYVLIFTPLPVGPVTPAGGLLMITAWAALGIWAWRQ